MQRPLGSPRRTNLRTKLWQIDAVSSGPSCVLDSALPCAREMHCMRTGVGTAWVRSLIGERCRDDSAFAGDIVLTLPTSIRHALSSDLLELLAR